MPAARYRDEIVEAPPRYDAYFGMLVTSFVATLIALILLWLDFSSYPSQAPAVPKVTPTVVAPK
jgi:hypothetical protein